eukprot:4957226-Amphidinium_carterae.1
MHLRRAASADAQGVEMVNALLPELVRNIPRNRRIQDVTNEAVGQGDDVEQDAPAVIPATPRLPGTPSALTRRRRSSVISTTVPSET